MVVCIFVDVVLLQLFSKAYFSKHYTYEPCNCNYLKYMTCLSILILIIIFILLENIFYPLSPFRIWKLINKRLLDKIVRLFQYITPDLHKPENCF